PRSPPFPYTTLFRSSLAQELAIAERVRWLGWQSSLTAFYRSLDLMVFNTDWDALGRAPLEAIGAGVPVVVSAVHSGSQSVLKTIDRKSTRLNSSHVA